MKKYIAILLLVFSGSVQAYEKWECFSYSKPAEVLVTTEITERDENGFNGAVTAAGTRHLAFYVVRGLDRRWDFGSSLDYSFMIDVEGKGKYYDFTGVESDVIVQPKLLLGCKLAN